MKKRYNECLKGIVDDCRAEATKAGAKLDDWSQQDILDVMNYWFGLEDRDEEWKLIIEDLVNNQKRS